jgi:hypothetical protein
MIKTSCFALLLAIVCGLQGCATPRQAYLSQHPELSAEHRKLIEAGTLADRDPVVGMTREQIRLTMGTDPWQVTKIDGVDAWVWVKPKRNEHTMISETSRSGSPGMGSFANQPKTDDLPKARRIIRTTVLFEGNVATRVDVTEEAVDRT